MNICGLIKTSAVGIAKGYLQAVKSAASVVASLLLVAGISAVVVTPLWFLATRYTKAYTIVSVCGFCVVIVATVTVRLAKDKTKRKIFIRRVVRVFIFILFAALLYFIALLYAWGFYVYALPATIAYIAITGLVLYGKRFGKK
jgi:amino acid transporter